MKVDFLKGLNLDDDVIRQIQTESGKDVTNAKEASKSTIDSLNAQIEEYKKQLSQRESDFSNLQKQFESAGQSATKLKEVQEQFGNLQTRYNEETAQYKKKLEDQEYKFGITELINGVAFTSSYAKEHCIGQLMTDRLPISDGKIVGFDERLAKMKEADPDAFKTSEEKKRPSFAPPPNPEPNQNPQGENPFGFNFLPIRL